MQTEWNKKPLQYADITEKIARVVSGEAQGT